MACSCACLCSPLSYSDCGSNEYGTGRCISHAMENWQRTTMGAVGCVSDKTTFSWDKRILQACAAKGGGSLPPRHRNARCQLHQDRVAPGRCRPRAPTDPYVPALGHTAPRIMGSLRACKPNARCAREPAENAGGDGETTSRGARVRGCDARATSANDARLRDEAWTGPNRYP